MSSSHVCVEALFTFLAIALSKCIRNLKLGHLIVKSIWHIRTQIAWNSFSYSIQKLKNNTLVLCFNLPDAWGKLNQVLGKIELIWKYAAKIKANNHALFTNYGMRQILIVFAGSGLVYGSNARLYCDFIWAKNLSYPRLKLMWYMRGDRKKSHTVFFGPCKWLQGDITAIVVQNNKGLPFVGRE